MTNARIRTPRRKDSFTLVELLVVMAIGVILAVISADAFAKITRSSTVSTASQVLTGSLDFARQTAVTRNSDVEFRIYYLPDVNGSSTGALAQYRAFQSFLIADGATNALTKVTFLPNPAVIASAPAASSVINIGPQNPNAFGSPTIPVYGLNYQIIAFRFSPTGSLETPATPASPTPPADGEWFMSLVLQNDPVNASTHLPANFATIQLDPFTGRAKVFRP